MQLGAFYGATSVAPTRSPHIRKRSILHNMPDQEIMRNVEKGYYAESIPHIQWLGGTRSQSSSRVKIAGGSFLCVILARK